MKKLFLTTGLLSVLAMPAFAETKWFVGGSLGYAEPVFSDELEDDIDDDFWDDESGNIAMSLTGGMRFGDYNKIYNGGVSATLSYMPELGKISDGDANPLYMHSEADFTALYISYDNYIRISGDSKCRTDFIASIGLGHGWVKERLKITGYGSESFDDNGMLAVLKIGFGGDFVWTGWGWTATMNFIGLNADDDADLQGSYGFDLGVKYTF